MAVMSSCTASPPAIPKAFAQSLSTGCSALGAAFEAVKIGIPFKAITEAKNIRAKFESFIETSQSKFTANLHGVMQLDTAYYDQASPGPVATDLRRSGPALGASASNIDLTHARDLKLINGAADQLNREASDVLD